MKKPSTLAVLFNGAAILIAGASAVTVMRSIFLPDEIAPCSTRYEHGTRLSLERTPGELMTPSDLQARLSGTDWGILDNAEVVQRKDSPTGRALKVRLARSSEDTAAPAFARDGLGFSWTPRLEGARSSACLAYSVYLPDSFEFGRGGRLPGLMGAAERGPASEADFTTQYVWRDNGGLEIHGHMPGWPDSRWIPNDRRGYRFARGQWVALEQEVILNSPGHKDGILRVWADGGLKFEKSGLLFRNSSDVRVSGVAADVFANAQSAAAESGKVQQLWLSPLELRWQ